VGAATPKAGDVRNKWIWRADSTTKVNYAREYKVTASNGYVIKEWKLVVPKTRSIFV